ncbi:MAG: hypothetical protein LBL45_02530 [Treponema sp.]|nr:hypothetical protein [Treponema sp.]
MKIRLSSIRRDGCVSHVNCVIPRAVAETDPVSDPQSGSAHIQSCQA